MDRSAPLVIVGGGLAGALAALALADARPDLPVLLIEAGERIGGNHVWSFFDGDLDAAGKALVAPLDPVRWPRHHIDFPARKRTLGFGYNSIHSEKLDALMRARLDPAAMMTGMAVTYVQADAVTLADGRRIEAHGVIDARGPSGPMPGLELAWQKFVGIEFAVPGHGLDSPIIMDGTVEQIDGYRFVYLLPFAADRIFVEDTYYSDDPELDVTAIRTRIHEYAAAKGWHGDVLREETGLLPVLLDGDPDIFWPTDDPVARLGVAGGFFHPTTGYSLPLAVANALALVEVGDWSSGALAAWSRTRFLDHWNNGRFFRALDRMLFRAAVPDQRVRVFEHFYRLREPVIARFYAGKLSLSDQLRILTGKPPVPVANAMKALFA
ncbi:MAG: lycopene beta-cyclase CrtY [Sphingomicrobium sp.]